MLKRIFYVFIVLSFLVGLLAAAPVRPAAAESSINGISPDGMLNPDGTLRLDGSFNGALDVSAYDIQMDPQKGPVLSPIASMDHWSQISAGGGSFQGGINAVVVVGTDIYVGGGFRDAGDVPEADYIAKWNGSQWTSISNGGAGISPLSSGVDDLLYYGGNLYASGAFSTRNTSGALISNATNLAKWNGVVWSAVPGITANLNDNVKVIAADPTNNILYFGGEFTNVNGNNAADKVAGIDLDTSTLVVFGNNGPAGDGSLVGTVFSIAINSLGNVYVGGGFGNINNGGTSLPEADYIAKWDGANWSALGNMGAGIGALNSAVSTIAIDSSDNVYAGGWFSNAAGIPAADFIAKWNGSSWSALGNNGSGGGALIDHGGGTIVRDILINGNDIYAGGAFVGNPSIPTADFVARFNVNTNSWSGLGSNGAGDGSLHGVGVNDLAFSAGKLYVGGSIYDTNNNGTVLLTADYFSVWDGTDWSTLGDSNGSLNSIVNAMAVIGTDVYVGGGFYALGGDPRIDYLARWDGSSWNPVGNETSIRGSLNSTVEALALDGNILYVGGNFSTVTNNDDPVTGGSRIAKWDGSTWSALGSGLSGSVYSLAIDSNHNLYVGGSFTNAASIPEADYIAKWDGSAWSALAGNGASNGALNNSVFVLAIQGTNVYAGGVFTSVLDPSQNPIPNAGYLAKWNGTVWSAMDGIAAPIGNSVYAIEVSGNDIYIGGIFKNLNGVTSADHIAKWDGSNWSALGASNSGDGALNGTVQVIKVVGKYVYVGGGFTNPVNGASSLTNGDYIVRWDGLAWSALSSNGSDDGSLNSPVYVFQVVKSDLWVGGYFTNVNDDGSILGEADYLAALGIDIPPTVSSIVRANPNNTANVSVDFTVTFSESVTGVDASDFTLTQTGSVSGATISGLSGSGASYTVTVNTGSGNGTIRLNLKASGTGILDSINNPINGGFTTGQIYTIKKSSVFKSIGANDGWILESAENSGVGGTMNSSATTFNLGDDSARKQYRAILHFNTASIPDNAVITKVTLKIKKQGLSGTNPFTILGGLTVDMRKPSFGALALGLSDFQSPAGRTAVATFNPTPALNWFSAILNTSGKNYINKAGATQFRLRFATDDNNNAVADFMKFFSGNAAAGTRPQLIVEYKVP